VIHPGPTRRPGARGLLTGVVAMIAVGLAACSEPRTSQRADAPTEIGFSILAAQGQATAAPLWQPLLDDLSKAIGLPVKPQFAANYAASVEDMKRGAVQAGWFSARPATEAIDEARAEVVARTVNADGDSSYQSILIVRRGSGITLEEVLKCGQRFSMGLGDAHSTSGALAPAAFLFNPQRINPETCFKSLRPANQERNAVEVASGILDVATSNTATRRTLERQNPVLAGEIETIWQSPPIPEGGILVRSDLDPVIKEKIRSFFLTYGRGNDAAAARQRQILAALDYTRFIAADEAYLDPVRELIADQALTEARRKGDSAAAAAAERELSRLRARREVQP
jgi:phosphonate transport system substrate-binding protein